MHPWMLEQVAREHRRDLQALAAPSRRWMPRIPRRRASGPGPAPRIAGYGVTPAGASATAGSVNPAAALIAAVD